MTSSVISDVKPIIYIYILSSHSCVSTSELDCWGYLKGVVFHQGYVCCTIMAAILSCREGALWIEGSYNKSRRVTIVFLDYFIINLACGVNGLVDH